MKLIALQPFKWAHQHVNIKEYAEGDEIITDDADLIRVAVHEEGWARDAAEQKAPPAPAENMPAAPAPRTKKSAPANKDAGPAPGNK